MLHNRKHGYDDEIHIGDDDYDDGIYCNGGNDEGDGGVVGSDDENDIVLMEMMAILMEVVAMLVIIMVMTVGEC